ncbi:hypothetical protein BC833DRAFT_606523 [Globomyces pollinis-pini]|nr:hypothetical protein BC833DRAFT_606523 [Globomyces pollinis-pini]
MQNEDITWESNNHNQSKFLSPLNVQLPNAPISPLSGSKLSTKNINQDVNPRFNDNSLQRQMMSPHFNLSAMSEFQTLMSPPITPADALNSHFSPMPQSAASVGSHSFDMLAEKNLNMGNFDINQHGGLNILDPNDYATTNYQEPTIIYQENGNIDGDLQFQTQLTSPMFDGQSSPMFEQQNSPFDQQYNWMNMENNSMPYQLSPNHNDTRSPIIHSSHQFPATYPSRHNPLQRLVDEEFRHSGSESSMGSNWATNPYMGNDNWNVTRVPEPVFACTFPGCTKTFTKQTNLKSHSRIHHTERNYNCQECGTSFRRSHDLKRHQRSLHSDVKPFGCARCGKRFSRMDALKRHTSRITSACYVSNFSDYNHSGI